MAAELMLVQSGLEGVEIDGEERSPIAQRWMDVKSKLRLEVGEDVFASWFARAELEQFQDDIAILSVPTKFLKSWIQSHYRDVLTSVIACEWPVIKRVDFIVRQVANAAKAQAPTIALVAPVLTQSDGFRAQDMKHESVAATSHAGASSGACIESHFDARCSFNNFRVSKSNAFAHSAAMKLASETLNGATPYNPLFIHGGVGLGKTHLLQAVGQEVLKAHGKRVLYLTAERFMYEFVAALRSHNAMNFKESLRGIDVLLIDDLQFLQGKNIQQEFCHIMNALLESARAIVVAADRLPADLDNLDARIRSRLGAGLVVEIGSPDEDLRFDILKTRAGVLMQQHSDLMIPDTALRLIAASVATNGRDLEGALNRVVAQHQFSRQPLTEQMVEDAIRDLIKLPDNKRIKIEDIQRFVAKHYNVSRADLLSNRRTQTIVRPRQVAMYLAKMLTPRSLPEIGRRFGGRDHTTVLHAVRKVETMLPNDPSLQNDIDVLKRILEG